MKFEHESQVTEFTECNNNYLVLVYSVKYFLIIHLVGVHFCAKTDQIWAVIYLPLYASRTMLFG